MASAALRRNQYDTVRAILRGLEAEGRTDGESSDANAAAILRTAFEDPKLRDQMADFLGPLLSRALTGSIPDYSAWEPRL